MDPKQWSATLSRIGPQDSDDLDDLLGRFAPRGGELGRDVFPMPEDSIPLPIVRLDHLKGTAPPAAPSIRCVSNLRSEDVSSIILDSRFQRPKQIDGS